MKARIIALALVTLMLLSVSSAVAEAKGRPNTPPGQDRRPETPPGHANRPEETPSGTQPAIPATPAEPHPGEGPATPAIPATPASPARGASEIVYGVSIDVAPDAQEVEVGGTATFSVSVTNLGNREDTITLSTAGVPDGWSVSLASDTVSLEPKESATVVLNATPATDALDGSWATVHVTATCGDGTTAAMDEFTLTVRAPVDNPTEGQRLQLAFVVDISGSMWYKEFGYDATIERFMTDLVNALEAEGIVVEYSLVTYGGYYNYHQPKIELGFTGNADVVRTEIQNLSRKIGGWCEYMYWASLTGLQQDWDSSEDTIKVMTVITDEDADDKYYNSYGSPGVTSEDVINTANQQDVTIYGIDGSADEWRNATQDLNTLANGTGGQVFTEQTMYNLIALILSIFF